MNKKIKIILIIISIIFCFILTSSVKADKNIYPYDSRQGIGMAYPYFEDFNTLQVSWFYVWGTDQGYLSDSRYVPMSYAGEDPNLPINYSGYLLVFNEPNNPQPYGAGITPQVASDRYRILGNKYPNAKFVVGGVSVWDSVYYGNWLSTFRSLCSDCKAPYAYAIHGYVESWITADQLKIWWTKHENELGKIWITEFADTLGRPQVLWELISWIKTQPNIERYAVFTNRAIGNESWYPQGWNVQLVGNDGNITALGKSMRNYNLYYPMIVKNTNIGPH